MKNKDTLMAALRQSGFATPSRSYGNTSKTCASNVVTNYNSTDRNVWHVKINVNTEFKSPYYEMLYNLFCTIMYICDSTFPLSQLNSSKATCDFYEWRYPTVAISGVRQLITQLDLNEYIKVDTFHKEKNCKIKGI